MTDGNEIWHRGSGAHDGRPHCELCSDSGTGREHEWCDLTYSLVCQECCRDLAHFEPGPLIAALSRTERVLTPQEILRVCAACSHRLGDDEEELLAPPEQEQLPS